MAGAVTRLQHNALSSSTGLKVRDPDILVGRDAAVYTFPAVLSARNRGYLIVRVAVSPISQPGADARVALRNGRRAIRCNMCTLFLLCHCRSGTHSSVHTHAPVSSYACIS